MKMNMRNAAIGQVAYHAGMNTETGLGTAIKSMPPLLVAKSDLDNTVARVGRQVDRLLERLEPLLMPQSPQEAKNANVSEVRKQPATFVIGLESINQQLGDISVRLGAIADRLSV